MTLGVIPSGAVRTVWPLESFYLSDDRQALVENLTAKIRVTAAEEITDYSRAFEALSRSAVYGDDARDVITAALDAL